MRDIARLLTTIAVCGVLAAGLRSPVACAASPDDTMRGTIRALSRSEAQAEPLRQVVAIRPSLAYQIVLDVCEEALRRRAEGANAEPAFARAQRVTQALPAEHGAGALRDLINLYRGYDRVTAGIWLQTKDRLTRASQLAESGRTEEALELASSVARAATDLGDPTLLAETQRIAAISFKGRAQLDEARRLTESALRIYRAIGHVWGMGRASGNLGRLHRLLENYEEALAFAKDARLLAQIAGDPETLAGEWEASGLVYNRLGRYRLALEHLSNALRTYPHTAHAPVARAVILQNIGLVYENLGMPRDAAAQFRAALGELGDDEAQEFNRAMVRASLGNVYGKLGDYDKARLHYRSALGVFRLHGQAAQAAMTEMNLGKLDLQQGELDGALARYRNVEAVARTGRISQMLAQALLGEIEVALRRGDPRQALALATDACQPGAGAPMRAHCEHARGLAYRELGDLAAAAESYSKAVSALEELYAEMGDLTENSGESLLEDVRRYYLEAIEVSMRLHQVQPQSGHDRYAFKLSELAKSRVFQDQIRRTGVRLGGARDAPFQERITRERAAVALVVRLSRLARLAPAAEKVDAEAARVDAVQQLRRIREQLRLDYPAYRDVEQTSTVSIDAIQAVLAPDEALVSYALGEARSVAFVIRRDEFTAVPIAIGEAEMAARIVALRARLEPDGRTRPLPELAATLRGFDPGSARALHAGVFGPIAPHLAGATRIYVAGDGALFLLPFGVLVDSSYDAARFQADRDRADGHRSPYLAEYASVPWLGRRLHFRYLPAAGSLVYLRAGTRLRVDAWELPLIAFADPKFANEDGGTAGPGHHPRLPGTAQEANAIAEILGADRKHVYLRERASKANAYSADLRRARYVLFATHGFAGGDYAGGAEPALLLAESDTARPLDSMLTMSEVIGLDLSAQLTVLSACSTAGQPSRVERYGEGFSGLARSFIYAGSRAVLVTHWSVFDTVARDFIIDFFKVAPHRGADEALSQAVTAMSGASITDEATGVSVALAHPMFWAGYALVGD